MRFLFWLIIFMMIGLEIVSLMADQYLIKDGIICRCLNESIEDVDIDESMNVSQIGNYCFSHFQTIKKVNLCSSVNIIGKEAFFGCKNILEIRFTSNVSLLMQTCFSQCTSAKVYLPSKFINVKIEQNVFAGSNIVGLFTLDDSISIENGAFTCTTFYDMVIVNISTVPRITFCMANFLSGVHITENVQMICMRAFMYASIMGRFNIPSHIRIDDEGFFGVSSDMMSYLTLSSNFYGNSVFEHSFAFSAVDLSNYNMSYIPTRMFYNTTISDEVTFPKIITRIYDNAFSLTYIRKIKFEGRVFLCDYAFEKCALLESIENNEYGKYGYGALENCTKLSGSFNLTEAALSEAFKNTAIRKVYTNFNPSARLFYNCTSLENVVLGPNVKMIDQCAFAFCSSLKIDLILKNYKIGFGCFLASGILSVTMNCVNVPTSSFENCTNLKKIDIACSEINSGAFQNLNYIDNLSLSAEIIHENGFENCIINNLYIITKINVKIYSIVNTKVNTVVYYPLEADNYNFELFISKPIFILPYNQKFESIFGYVISEKVVSSKLIIVISIGSTFFICVLITGLIWQRKKSKKLQDRLSLETTLINDFG